MKRIFTNICLPALLAIFFATSAVDVKAQGVHTTAVNMGLGGGGGAYMAGYHANFINPANLMLSDRNTRVSIGLLGGLSTSAGGSLVNISLYNNYFTVGNVIDTDMALRISDDWFGSGSGSMAYLGFNLNLVPLGFSYRRDDMAFSTAFRVRTMVTTGMSKGFFQLLLTGPNSEVFGNGRDVNLSLEMLAMGEWSVGYAMEVWRNREAFQPGTQRVYVGAAPKILFGMGYAKMGIDSRLQVTSGADPRLVHEFDYYIHSVGDISNDLESYYQERRVLNNKDASFSDFVDDDSFSDAGSVQGTGFGLDLGATWEWYMNDVSIPVIGSGPQILRASFSVTDIGSINFNKNPGDFRAVETFIWDGINIDYDRIEEEFDGSTSDYFEHVMQDSIGSDIYGNFSPRDISSHRIGLNPMMNIGGALSMGRLGVMMDIGKGFNNRGINSTRFYTALGTEYLVVGAIPLRFGMRMGGYSGVNFAFGTGLSLKNFEFTTSVMTTASSKRGGSNISAAWSGLVIRF